MWIQSPGVVNDQLVLLGTRKNNIYLVKGESDMLIGGGCPWIVSELMTQIRSWQIDMQRVKYLFVGHSHFDHCGAVPYLQKQYPHLQVVASQQATDYFSMPKAVSNARRFVREAMEQMGVPNEFEGNSLDFDTIHVSRVLHDGDEIDIGNGIVFKVFETPGHSRCAIVLYAAAQKWLFPSDAVSIPIKEGWDFACTASESFIDYLNSLKKLIDLDVALCAWEHFGLMTGEHADQIVRRVMRSTVEFKENLKTKVKQSGDQNAIAEQAAHEWLAQTDFNFIPFKVMNYITSQMVKNALEENLEIIDII